MQLALDHARAGAFRVAERVPNARGGKPPCFSLQIMCSGVQRSSSMKSHLLLATSTSLMKNMSISSQQFIQFFDPEAHS